MKTLLKSVRLCVVSWYNDFIKIWTKEQEEQESVSPLTVLPIVGNSSIKGAFLLDLKRRVWVKSCPSVITAPLALFNRTFNLMELSRPFIPGSYNLWTSLDAFSVNTKLSNVYLRIRRGYDDPVVCATPVPVNIEFIKDNDGGYSNYSFKATINDFSFIGLGNNFIFSFSLIGKINLLTGDTRITISQQPIISACTVSPSAIEIAGYDIETWWTPLEALAMEQLNKNLAEIIE